MATINEVNCREHEACQSLEEFVVLPAEVKEAMLQSIVSTLPSMQNGSPPVSSPTTSLDICRICHCEADVDAPLIAPCICSGSLRYVHQTCLQQWIKSSNTRKCELCKFEFVMQTKIKPFRQWEKLQMTSVERRKIFCSVTFHFVAITCVVWSLYVLIDRTAEEVKAGQLEWPFWTKLIVVAIGFSGGLVFMYVQCKLYFQLFRRWRAFNRIIYVQNAPPKAAVAASYFPPSTVVPMAAPAPVTSHHHHSKPDVCSVTSVSESAVVSATGRQSFLVPESSSSSSPPPPDGTNPADRLEEVYGAAGTDSPVQRIT